MYGQNQTSEAWTYSPRSFEGLLIFLFEVLGMLCERVGRLTFKEVASTCGKHEKNIQPSHAGNVGSAMSYHHMAFNST